MDDGRGLSQGGAPQLRITVDSPQTSVDRTSLPTSPTMPSFSDTNFTSSRNSGAVNTLRRSATQSTLQRNSLLAGITSNKRNSAVLGAGPPNARLSKIIADLFLLAGRLKDATTWYGSSHFMDQMKRINDVRTRYEDAVTQFRSSNNDPVWYAAALEGQATVAVLEAWASTDGLVNLQSFSNLLRSLTD